MFCDNIDVIEFMQRRIESDLQIWIYCMIDVKVDYDRQRQENIGILVTKLQEMLNDYEQQWIENDDS